MALWRVRGPILEKQTSKHALDACSLHQSREGAMMPPEPIVCLACQKKFTFELEDIRLFDTPRLQLLPTLPRLLSHCEGGNSVPVIGRVLKFYEFNSPGEKVEATPHLSDFQAGK
jgi:hypothetical protein